MSPWFKLKKPNLTFFTTLHKNLQVFPPIVDMGGYGKASGKGAKGPKGGKGKGKAGSQGWMDGWMCGWVGGKVDVIWSWLILFDGFRNPAWKPVEVDKFILLFTWFYASQVVVWDFFHQQYESLFPGISHINPNRIYEGVGRWVLPCQEGIALVAMGGIFRRGALILGQGALFMGKHATLRKKHVKEILAIRDSSLLMWFQNPHACLLQYS